jgi:hypothetical protein
MPSILIFHYPSSTHKTLQFPTNRAAFNSFAERCDELGLEWEELDNGDLRAGGLGSNFVIDLMQNP